jgi:CBS-domain-containing membrane protein
MSPSNLRECAPVDISDADAIKAMKAMQGYIDITPADFREVYRRVIPVALGAGVMLTIALIVNNISKGRRYPEFWL